MKTSICHGCDLNVLIFAIFLRIFPLCFQAATVVAKYPPLARVYNTCTVSYLV
jgi:hypothetical protein